MIAKLKRLAYVDVGKKQTLAGLDSSMSEKEKGVGNPRPIVLNASALPVHHPDLLYYHPLCDNMIDKLKRVAYVDV